MASRAKDLLGVHLVAPPPVGHLQVDLTTGLTAMYGVNGIGKSKVLEALRGAVEPLAMQYDTYEPGVDGVMRRRRFDPATMPEPIDVLYQHSGFHLYRPFTKRTWSNGTSSLIADVLGTEIGRSKEGMNDPFDGRSRRADWEEVLLHVMSSLPFDAEVSEAEYLLGEGRWCVSALPFCPVNICDPDPWNGPLNERWCDSARRWDLHLAAPSEPQYEQECLRGARWRGSFLLYDAAPGDRTGGYWSLQYKGHLHGEIVSVPVLPPLPDQLGLGGYPDWFAFPMGGVGVFEDYPPFAAAISEDPTRDPATLTRDAIHYRETELSGPVDMLPPLQSRTTKYILKKAAAVANRSLATFFEAPPLLKATLRPKDVWFRGYSPIAWTATVDIGEEAFPINELGQAHRRYSSFAIQRAIAMLAGTGSTSGRKVFAFIDEPEQITNNFITSPWHYLKVFAFVI